MALTAGSVLTWVRDHVDEASAGYWSDNELYRKIDMAAKELHLIVLEAAKRFWQRSETITLLANGTFDYDFTNDIYQVESLKPTQSGYEGIVFRAARSSDQAFMEGLRSDIVISAPAVFDYDVIAAKTLRVSPRPRVAMAVRASVIIAIPLIDDSADTFGDLPDGFLPWVGYKAAHLALNKQPNYKGKWQDEADRILPRILATARQRINQGPEIVEEFQDEAA